MQPNAFLDTNVLLRHVLHDQPEQSRRATALIEAIERGDRAVRLADTVIFETVFTLEKTYRAKRADIRDALLPIINLPGAVLPGKRVYIEVFALWADNAGLSFADCYHLCLTKQLGLSAIITFDRKMNRLDGIAREEP
jgi:predicted nucleic acid-binding protein